MTFRVVILLFQRVFRQNPSLNKEGLDGVCVDSVVEQVADNVAEVVQLTGTVREPEHALRFKVRTKTVVGGKQFKTIHPQGFRPKYFSKYKKYRVKQKHILKTLQQI